MRQPADDPLAVIRMDAVPPVVEGHLTFRLQSPDRLLGIRPDRLAGLDVPLPDAKSRRLDGKLETRAVERNLFGAAPLRLGALFRVHACLHPVGHVDREGEMPFAEPRSFRSGKKVTSQYIDGV